MKATKSFEDYLVFISLKLLLCILHNPVVVAVLHDLSCKMFLFRFTKKKFEREARERNEASNNASVTLMAGVSKKLQSPTLYSVVYVKRNLVCKPGKSQQTVAGGGEAGLCL